MKEPDNAPLEIEQLGELTAPPESEQDESVEGKPEPDTSTLAPTEAESGLSRIDAAEDREAS